MKTFKEFFKESEDVPPEGVPKHIWDLHKKHVDAEKKAQSFNYGGAKRNHTMTFRRLHASIVKHMPDDEKGQYELHAKMNQERRKIEED